MMAPLVRRTWAPRGQTPVLYQKTRSYKKVSVIAALTVPPKYMRVGLYFSLYSNTNVTAKRAVRFLSHLCRQIQGPIMVVWDRGMAHRAKVVNRLLQRRKNLHCDFFPPYAPELNPVEQLWGHLKTNPLANWAPHDLESLAYKARYQTGRLRKRKGLLRSFLYTTPLFLRPE